MGWVGMFSRNKRLQKILFKISNYWRLMSDDVTKYLIASAKMHQLKMKLKGKMCNSAFTPCRMAERTGVPLKKLISPLFATDKNAQKRNIPVGVSANGSPGPSDGYAAG